MNIVDAVKTSEDTKRVAELLLKHRGQLYADIWMLGVNMALRISDLLAISMDEATSAVRAGKLIVKEGKTGKRREIALNATAKGIITRRRASESAATWLFEVNSNRAKGKAVSRISVGRVFKEIGDVIGVNIGTHSMRKTLGWNMHNAGVPIERICKVLNHSDPSVTMAYIGLDQQTIDDDMHEFEMRF